MPTKLVVITLCSIFAIMVGGVLTVVGLVREITALTAAGIALAAAAFLLFLVVFLRTLLRNRRENPKKKK